MLFSAVSVLPEVGQEVWFSQIHPPSLEPPHRPYSGRLGAKHSFPVILNFPILLLPGVGGGGKGEAYPHPCPPQEAQEEASIAWKTTRNSTKDPVGWVGVQEGLQGGRGAGFGVEPAGSWRHLSLWLSVHGQSLTGRLDPGQEGLFSPSECFLLEVNSEQ